MVIVVGFPIVTQDLVVLCWDLHNYNSCDKRVFKKEFNAEGKVEKFKTHLGANGYSHMKGIDFGEISLFFQVNFHLIFFGCRCCF
jgi:hypothetical protein